MRSSSSSSSSPVSAVVVMALAAKSENVSFASHSTSATYATSIVTHRLGIDKFIIPRKESEELAPPETLSSCEQPHHTAVTSADSSPAATNNLFQLLLDMKLSFEVLLNVFIT